MHFLVPQTAAGLLTKNMLVDIFPLLKTMQWLLIGASIKSTPDFGHRGCNQLEADPTPTRIPTSFLPGSLPQSLASLLHLFFYR